MYIMFVYISFIQLLQCSVPNLTDSEAGDSFLSSRCLFDKTKHKLVSASPDTLL